MDNDNIYGTLSIQKELLELLIEFHSFCQNNSIVYSLDSGTLLGAIRHNGFIPWDDDVDVVMTRKNRQRLLDTINSSPILDFQRNLWVDRVYFTRDEARCGYRPTIDIFILDNAPNSRIIRKLKVLIIAFLQGMIKEKPDYKKFSLINKVLSFVTHEFGKLFPMENKLRWYDKVSDFDNNKKTIFASCYNYMFSELGVLYHADSLEKIVTHQFESLELPITYDYDYYLTSLYGDYMTPPKTYNRKPTHLH